jgi:(1->4)-alpha-D-glucan 1-alpha-D-glucosylmutase
MTDRRVPSSTYRLQLHAGFGFGDAAAIVPYLSRLGVSHLYLSPILQAVPGSMHGYDVVDHSHVSTDLGGETALLELADTAHEHDLGIVVDVVPNHMAVPTPEHLNRQLWETLRLGQSSSTAHWFDVDWEYGEGKLALPILGDSLDGVLAAGQLTFGEHQGEEVVCYGDHLLPIAPGSRSDDLAETLAGQHYTLAGWRESAQILNYRRFFDVDTLIAVRVELPDVFDATHATLLDLRRRGVIDGFRIDHPDGLADPQGYLERLRDHTDGAWVVVEKILAPGESLPTAWPCAGTTGYDAIRAIQTSLVPAVGPDLDIRWQAVGGEPSYERAELASKRQVVGDLFQAEVRWLARSAVAAAAAAGDRLTTGDAHAALAEMLAHVEVYRAYLRLGLAPDPEALQRLESIRARARGARPDLAASIEVLSRLLADTATDDPATRDLVVRFQQVCGPVMAKGVEDTMFYRWHRMVGLNEVGGDPRSLDAPDPATMHTWAEEQVRDHPEGMTGLSTHDTKRSEDVRTRLLAAAENLQGWDEVVQEVQREAANCEVDASTAYLLAQTLLGSWPINPDRLRAYVGKAAREAKLFTSWQDPNRSYEERILNLARSCLAGRVADTLHKVVQANAQATRATTLAVKLLQLTLPGVPDIYQGTALVEPSLVDPDKRRPVDYARRRSLLDKIDAAHGTAAPAHDLDTEKLWLTSRVLRLRRERRELFDGSSSYAPLVSRSPHLLGFLRAGRLATVVTRWPGLLARNGWDEASLDLPPGEWTNLLTGTRLMVGDARVRGADLLSDLPVALLLQEP